MKNILEKLAEFLDTIGKEAKNLDFEVIDDKILRNFIDNKQNIYQYDFEMVLSEIENKLNTKLLESEKNWYYTCPVEIQWSRPEQKSKEGFISGGFYINGLTDIFFYPINFWERDFAPFEQMGQANLFEEPSQFNWIVGTTAVASPFYTPEFGCVKRDLSGFPNEFFFYDSGLIYLLPFKSFEEYLEAMMASASVRCWQYFYINPQIIIQKNAQLNYFTWSLHLNTNLGEGLNSLYPVKDVKFNRLDMINEYLERCVRLLPDSFPFLDFSYHQNYYNDFEKLYSATKNNK
jgi:hypothetical protein